MAGQPARQARWWRGGALGDWVRSVGTFALTVLLCLTPLTALLVTGWIMRLMRREAAIAAVRVAGRGSRREALARMRACPELAPFACWPGWLGAGEVGGTSRVARLIRDLWDLLRLGLGAQVALSIATLAFGLPLALSWWAGWENSFNKGYEQAFVGPLLAALGIATGLVILPHLSMAAAHMAVEGRATAMFELGTIRRLVNVARWRNVALTALSLALALPLMVLQVAPTFVEQWRPGFADLSAIAMQGVGRRLHLLTTVYLVLALIVLRRWQARVYAGAALQLDPVRTPAIHAQAEVAGWRQGSPNSNPKSRIGGVSAAIVQSALWLVFVVSIYVAQFANHAWWSWLNHPLLALPWVFRPW